MATNPSQQEINKVRGRRGAIATIAAVLVAAPSVLEAACGGSTLQEQKLWGTRKSAFDGRSLKGWIAYPAFKSSDGGYYDPNNVYVDKSGQLVVAGSISAPDAPVPEGVTTPRHHVGGVAWLNQPLTYCRVTTVAEFPVEMANGHQLASHKATGLLWPWNDAFPSGDEYDNPEFFDFTRQTVSGYANWADQHGKLVNQEAKHRPLGKGFHTFVTEWTPKYIRYTVDGTETLYITDPRAISHEPASLYPAGRYVWCVQE